jgi:hypothetical protein
MSRRTYTILMARLGVNMKRRVPTGGKKSGARRGKAAKAERRTAPPVTHRSRSSDADLGERLDRPTRELAEARRQLAEALEQQTATPTSGGDFIVAGAIEARFRHHRGRAAICGRRSPALAEEERALRCGDFRRVGGRAVFPAGTAAPADGCPTCTACPGKTDRPDAGSAHRAIWSAIVLVTTAGVGGARAAARSAGQGRHAATTMGVSRDVRFPTSRSSWCRTSPPRR